MFFTLVPSRSGALSFRWTRDDYHKAAGHGHFQNHRVELIDGEIFERAEPFRWTRSAYYALAELGLFQDRRVQLIDGEIVERSPQGSMHSTAVVLGYEALRGIFGEGYTVRSQLPLVLGLESEPEPGIAVVRGSPLDFKNGHPTTALLVLEISYSTLYLDARRKAGLYARAGIADYWIVNLAEERLDVHRKPAADQSAEFGGRYDEVRSLTRGETISPLVLPAGVIKVADLLP